MDKKLVKTPGDAREELYKILEDKLDGGGLAIYFDSKPDWRLESIYKDGNLLVRADDSFADLFQKLDFDLVHSNKSDRYKDRFRMAYESCHQAIKSKGNLSLNTAVIGLLGPLDRPDMPSNGYNIYDRTSYSVAEIKLLAGDVFPSIKGEYISIADLSKELTIVSDSRDLAEDDSMDENEYSKNKIIFGPPGTGKSYSIKEKMGLINVAEKDIIRITFHPEYSYYEFVGQYKPVVGYERVSNEIRLDGDSKGYDRPFVYYDFVPGPFTKAIIRALDLKDKSNVLLMIEEINRGNSSAIFGDIFQLLDRVKDPSSKFYGESEYSIDIDFEMKEYIKKELNWDEDDWMEAFPRGFVLPKNLYIYATMNTSDQSLYPMDSAFKRRWDMEYIYIDYREKDLKELYLPSPYEDIKWLDFIRVINGKIVEYTQVDDKQMGQWFVGRHLSKSELLGKVFSYLWFDIFRHNPGLIFKDSIRTFDDIKAKFEQGVLREELFSGRDKND